MNRFKDFCCCLACILLGGIGQLLGQAGSVSVVDHIVGFEAIKEAGAGTYTFCPMCISDDGSEQHPCNAAALRSYLFEWKFAEGDYSLSSKPTRHYTSKFADGQQVSLRVTGIKEERTGPCISDPGCTSTYYTSLAPDDWAIVYDESQTLHLTTGMSREATIVADQYLHGCLEDAKGLAICVGEPYCRPVWGAEIVYPAIFYNPTNCDYTLQASWIDHIQRWTDGTWMDDVVECEDFWPSSAIRCPKVGAPFQITLVVPAHSSRVLLTNHLIPDWDEELDSTQHEIVLEATATPDPFSDSACDSLTLRATHHDTVVTSIDPNKKWIVKRQQVYFPGDYIRFAIQFKNSGLAKEGLVYVEDPLDLRLDISKVEFLSGRIDGPEQHAMIGPRQVTEQRLPGTNGNVYQMEFESHGFYLGPEDSGTVLFRIPVMSAAKTTLPLWLMKPDTTFDTLENRGYTMFSSEGVVYETEPVHFVVAQINWQVGKAFWISVAGLLAVLGLGIAAIFWQRKR